MRDVTRALRCCSAGRACAPAGSPMLNEYGNYRTRRHGNIVWRSNSVRRWACVRGAVAAGSRHSCSQSVSLWARDARGHVIASPPPPPGPRLLTDITCATADQPACHVIATAARIQSDRGVAHPILIRLVSNRLFFCYNSAWKFIFVKSYPITIIVYKVVAAQSCVVLMRYFNIV